MHTPARLILIAATVLMFQAPAPANAMDSEKVRKGTADLTKARAFIKAKNWQAAEAELLRLEKLGPDADVYNLLGFSVRKQGRFDPSYAYYMKALKLDPDHKSAHEYLGELYLQKGELAKARAQAATLARLCPQGCEEREDLDKSIAAYKQ